jgi:TPR repeat protein
MYANGSAEFPSTEMRLNSRGQTIRMRLVAILTILLAVASIANAESFDENKAKAENGDATAQRQLGSMYSNGRGVPQDYSTAYAWFSVAIVSGDDVARNAREELALRMTAEQLAEGRQIASEFLAKSVKETRAKAELGDASAQGQLGLVYQNGQGVPQDYIQAHAWLNVASANGDENAATARDELAERMSPEQLAEAQSLAREYFESPEQLAEAQSREREYIQSQQVNAQTAAPRTSTQPEAASPNFARIGPYVGLGIIGAKYTKAEQKDEDFLAELGYIADVNYELTAGFDLQAGYRLNPHVAAQIHFQYVPGTEVESCFEFFGEETFEIDTWTLTGDVKIYALTDRLQPYFLVGLGAMHLEFDDIFGENLPSVREFAVRVGGGFDYYMTEHVVLYLEIGGVLPSDDLKHLDQFTFGTGLQYRF